MRHFKVPGSRGQAGKPHRGHSCTSCRDVALWDQCLAGSWEEKAGMVHPHRVGVSTVCLPLHPCLCSLGSLSSRGRGRALPLTL